MNTPAMDLTYRVGNDAGHYEWTGQPPAGYVPSYDYDGAISHWYGPAVHYDGLDLHTMWTPHGGFSMYAGSNEVTPRDMRDAMIEVETVVKHFEAATS